jgi:hypothetical protein
MVCIPEERMIRLQAVAICRLEQLCQGAHGVTRGAAPENEYGKGKVSRAQM